MAGAIPPSYLDENNALILKIFKNQNSGELSECAENQAKLRQNLMYLAAIADCQPQPPSMHAQLNIFTEEIIRAALAASLSSLLNQLDPLLRKTANLGSWQVISPVEAVGYVKINLMDSLQFWWQNLLKERKKFRMLQLLCQHLTCRMFYLMCLCEQEIARFALLHALIPTYLLTSKLVRESYCA
ncbi:hypothetical protein L1049_025715 [Liquidambar formosana]|uniref:SS18 N-terminal domain-containing protein n=1 Tax=Liquidambar formosana TaxID=63359 RepID=A0AAP0NFK4_LIQFO